MIVVEHDVGALTFDKIAEQANMSKGGILYHFSSKDKLIKAMVESFVAKFETGIATFMAEDDVEIGRYSRAYLRATMGESATTGADFDRLGASITVALFSFPNYTEIIYQQKTLST